MNILTVEAEKIGAEIVRALNLKMFVVEKNVQSCRYRTEDGTKTLEGLGRTMLRILEETVAGRLDLDQTPYSDEQKKEVETLQEALKTMTDMRDIAEDKLTVALTEAAELTASIGNLEKMNNNQAETIMKLTNRLEKAKSEKETLLTAGVPRQELEDHKITQHQLTKLNTRQSKDITELRVELAKTKRRIAHAIDDLTHETK